MQEFTEEEIAELEAHIQWAEGNHVDGSSDPSSSDGASNCDPIDHPETFKYDINGKLIGGPSELNTSAHEGAGLDQAGAEQSGEGTDPATGAANPTLVYVAALIGVGMPYPYGYGWVQAPFGPGYQTNAPGENAAGTSDATSPTSATSNSGKGHEAEVPSYNFPPFAISPYANPQHPALSPIPYPHPMSPTTGDPASPSGQHGEVDPAMAGYMTMGPFGYMPFMPGAMPYPFRKDMCRKWPNCPFGERCRYFHPANLVQGPNGFQMTGPPSSGRSPHRRQDRNNRTSRSGPPLCRNFPDCQFGSKCRYYHPDSKH